MWNDLFAITFHHKKRSWIFPKEKFVEYEAEDEQWCRYFGIGKELETEDKITLNNIRVRSIDTFRSKTGHVITRLELIDCPVFDY